MKKIFFPIFLISILMTACGGSNESVPVMASTEDQYIPASVTAEGTLLPEQNAELGFVQGGVVKEIFIHEGESVQEGEIIACLIGSETSQAELIAAKLEYTLALQALESIHRNSLLTASQTEQALLDAQTDYESLSNEWSLDNDDEITDLEFRIDNYIFVEEDYRSARLELDDVVYLDEDDRKRIDAQDDFDKEVVSLNKAYIELKAALAENDKSLDSEVSALLGAISDLEAARELQTRLNDENLDPDVIEAAQDRVDTASAYIAAAETALQFYELRAPFSGELLNLDLSVGEIAQPLMPIAYVADTTTWVVETMDLPEIDIAEISIGDVATVKLDAFPDEEFTGVVTGITPVGKLYLGDMTYQITILLDQVDSRFMWNMTATVSVNIDDN